MSTTVISVEKVSKLYRLGQVGTGTLAHDVNRWWHRVRGKEDPYTKVGETNDRSKAGSSDYFWALRDVNFEVKQGEVLGIIGRNGAGKSTLLKILSRVTTPTSGLIKVKGRIASLLEVGTGFHPELTGRENIYLNGAILGMRHREIHRKFDEIVAFAEVDQYIDTPVKRYSSGMYVRLAFAVAAHLEPEILIVDEVLAVGDAEFQSKCLGKMSTVAQGGRTVLFVSHNMSAVRTLCHRGIILDAGRKDFDGEAPEAIHAYSSKAVWVAGSRWTRPDDMPGHPVAFEEIHLSLSGEQPLLRLNCDMRIRCRQRSAPSFIAVDICDRTFSPIMQVLPESMPFMDGVPGVHRVQLEVDLPPLIPGNYLADFWLGSHYNATFDHLRRALGFEVTVSPSDNRSFPHSCDHGCIVPPCRYTYSVHSPQAEEVCSP